MESNFTTSFFVNNRTKLKELFMGTAPIVLTANGLMQRDGDNSYPFHQNANFWYLTGINDPDIILVMDKNKDYLIVPSRSDSRQAFDGSINYEDLSSISGIDIIYDDHEGWKELGKRLKKVKHVATTNPSKPLLDHYGIYSNPSHRRTISHIKAINTSITILDISIHLQKLRVIKQPEEIAAISSAINITAKALSRVASKLKKDSYSFEYEIEADIIKTFKDNGSTGHAFDPIVASGSNATTLHYFKNNSQLQKHNLIVLDIGAEFDNYTSDITRTLPIGTATKRQRDVYDAVLDVQDYAYTLLKPGVMMRPYEDQIIQYLGEKLRELGLIKSISNETVRPYYPQLTSHFMGLEAHDAGDYNSPLQENMILTVEPGIYIKNEGIGVRIEDDVIVTASGIKSLSANIKNTLT